MSTRPTPLAQLSRRMPEAGRIRFGVKGDKGQPVALDQFRFTSESKSVIEALAGKYGGDVKAWSPGRGSKQWEVLTCASEIDVVVPPHALGETPIYELWSGGGIQRRCDGQVLQIPTTTPEGAIMQEQPCICDRKGNMECKPVTRLNVLLPDVPFTGTWRLEAKGWNAAHELPGMVDMVISLHEGGRLTRAILALEKRTAVSGGKTRHFVVPVMRIPATLEELAAGGAGVLGVAAALPELEAAPAEVIDDDVVVEAEIVEMPGERRLRSDFLRLSIQLDLSTQEQAGFVFAVSDGRIERLDDLSTSQLEKIVNVLTLVAEGKYIYEGLEGRRAKVIRAQK